MEQKNVFLKAIRIVFNIILQIVLAILVYEFGRFIYEQINGSIRHDISWGLGLELAKYLFITLAIIVAIANNYLKGKKHKLIAIGVVIAVFAMFFLKTIPHTPYRTTLLIGSAICGFLVNLFFIKGLFKKSE